jgi:hypothetical protein
MSKDEEGTGLMAQVMVGIHGNGLSHQLWMQEGGMVIEVSWLSSVDLRSVDQCSISRPMSVQAPWQYHVNVALE